MRVLTVNAGSSSLKLSLVQDGRSIRTYPDLDAALADDVPDAVGHRVVHGGHRTAPE
ncbi:MAG: acetate/propionate family kinase, partial [Actinomycetota bacterium]|nr:acetate/propionate family kinase [Actinomycetota bacterium]